MNKMLEPKVCIHGLGYVGLPLLLAASRYYDCTGVDPDDRRRSSIERRDAPIEDCTVANLLPSVKFKLSDVAVEADIHIVCVPTPVNESKTPDITILQSVMSSLSSIVRPDDIIIVESTIYPGLIEELSDEFFGGVSRANIAHCPERINPGDKKWGVLNINRVIGGNNDYVVKAGAEFYENILDQGAKILKLNSVKSAESAKILENIFRDVNIALVNEMAQAFYRMGIDTYEVISAAATKPFGFLAHMPGAGVGGHCIAVDPYYMIEQGKNSGFDHEFLRLARKINENMPTYTVNLAQNFANKFGRAISREKILVLGLAYKPDVMDDRESPSYQILKKLRNERNSEVCVFDPHLPLKSDFDSLDAAFDWASMVVIATAHFEFKEYDWEALDQRILIVDGRGLISQKYSEYGIPESIRSRTVSIGVGK